MIKSLRFRAKKDRTNFEVNLKNLTNQYNSRIKSSTGKFKFIGPSAGTLDGNMMLNTHNFFLEISSMGRKVKDVWLLKNKNLSFMIKEGVESWDFKYQKKTTNVEIFYSHNFQDSKIQLTSKSSNKTIKEILSNSSKKINSIQLSYGYNQNEKKKFIIKTSLLTDLPKAISSATNHEIGQAKLKANAKINKKITSIKKRLQNKLDLEKQKILNKLQIKIPKLKI